MQITTLRLVGEFGGKLKECERQINRALEHIATGEPTPERTERAREAGASVHDLRQRFNMVLSAHGPEIDDLVSGGGEGATLTLGEKEAWVVEGIDSLYERLRDVLATPG